MRRSDLNLRQGGSLEEVSKAKRKAMAAESIIGSGSDNAVTIMTLATSVACTCAAFLASLPFTATRPLANVDDDRASDLEESVFETLSNDNGQLSDRSIRRRRDASSLPCSSDRTRALTQDIGTLSRQLQMSRAHVVPLAASDAP